MRIGFFDCFSGVSGDMILGVLVDAGLKLDDLQAAVSSLGVAGIHLTAERVKRGAFVGTRVEVHTDERGHPHRHLPGRGPGIAREEQVRPPRAAGHLCLLSGVAAGEQPLRER